MIQWLDSLEDEGFKQEGDELFYAVEDKTHPKEKEILENLSKGLEEKGLKSELEGALNLIANRMLKRLNPANRLVGIEIREHEVMVKWDGFAMLEKRCGDGRFTFTIGLRNRQRLWETNFL